jgi:D-alanyl-D-alanine-carboxypeptidase/D-alanyl-D-alanine-endopeptidase
MMAHHISGRLSRIAVVAVVLVEGFAASASRARADALLDEMVAFTGQVFILDTKVPAVVIGAVRDGEISVSGFGERAGPGSQAPDGDTIMRIGSITKAFTGDVLAHLHGRPGRSADQVAARFRAGREWRLGSRHAA